MFILGVTGASGSGKSTFAKYLSLYGFEHIDTDLLARKILPDAANLLAEAFGKDIITSENTVDRKLLASRAFSSPENTEKLNQITHPLITKALIEELEEASRRGVTKIAIDGAALFEAGADKLCDITVAVCAEERTRLNRVILRDNITEEEATQRFSAQKPQSYYTSKSDFTIESNNYDQIVENTKKFLNQLGTGGKIL